MDKEYIEREAVLRHKRKMSGADFGGEFWDEAVLCEEILKIPKADVAEVKHGQWVPKETMIRSPFANNYYCSECFEDTVFGGNYCSNCGAKMDGG